jgi:streptogramin lyase
MNARLLIGGTVGLALLWGCAQSTGPAPGQPPIVQSNLTRSVTQATRALDFFNTPTIGSWPMYIVAGPQNALWFSEFFTNAIGRITTDGTITEFPLGSNNDIEGIAEGADGNLWFTEPGANAIGRMTPQGVVASFPIDAYDPNPRGITLGPDGNIWYTEFYDGYIGRVTPQGVITRFPIPDYQSEPWDVKAGPDGYLYVSESGADKIARFDPRTEQFKSPVDVPTLSATPWGILYAPDKHIWFTERRGNKIAEIVSGAQVREFAIAQQGSYPEAPAAGRDGDLWFTESITGDLGHINPATGKFGPIVVLPSGDIPNGIASGANKSIFFTVDNYTGPSQIGELVLH